MDFSEKLVFETKRSEVFLAWCNQRKDTLRERVTAQDVLRHFGVDLKFGGSDHEEQICCPFHGDKDPSARVYGSQGDSPSGVYCYVCRKRWDIFGLWGEFCNDPEMKFTAKLLGLERAFGITTPEAPEVNYEYKARGPTEEEIAVTEKLGVCEKRLRDNRKSFQLEGFLKVGKVLDLMHYQVKHSQITSEVALQRIQLVLNKIAEKSRG